MKAIAWILFAVGLGGLVWWLYRKFVSVPSGTTTQLRPDPAPQLPNPGLCESLVPIAAAGAGAYAGGPQGASVGMQAGGLAAQPLCDLSRQIGKYAVQSGKALGGAVKQIGSGAQQLAGGAAKATNKVAGFVGGGASTFGSGIKTGLSSIGSGIKSLF